MKSDDPDGEGLIGLVPSNYLEEVSARPIRSASLDAFALPGRPSEQTQLARSRPRAFSSSVADLIRL